MQTKKDIKSKKNEKKKKKGEERKKYIRKRNVIEFPFIRANKTISVLSPPLNISAKDLLFSSYSIPYLWTNDKASSVSKSPLRLMRNNFNQMSQFHNPLFLNQ